VPTAAEDPADDPAKDRAGDVRAATAPGWVRAALVPAIEVGGRERVGLLGHALCLSSVIHGCVRVAVAEAEGGLERTLRFRESRSGAPSHAAAAGGDEVGRPVDVGAGRGQRRLEGRGELRLEIAQQLLSRAGELGAVKRVLSHPQALAQCRGWLATHLADVPTEEVASTAAAAELAGADVALAAIASALAGELYGVPVLRARIEDNPHNSTRFLVIGRRPVGPTGRDKTSILFAMRNEPGSLYRILEPLARAKLNLTKIESRPAKHGPWEYVIFVDLEGHRDTPEVAPVLAEIGERTLYLKILGSYPAA